MNLPRPGARRSVHEGCAANKEERKHALQPKAPDGVLPGRGVARHRFLDAGVGPGKNRPARNCSSSSNSALKFYNDGQYDKAAAELDKLLLMNPSSQRSDGLAPEDGHGSPHQNAPGAESRRQDPHPPAQVGGRGGQASSRSGDHQGPDREGQPPTTSGALERHPAIDRHRRLCRAAVARRGAQQ